MSCIVAFVLSDVVFESPFVFSWIVPLEIIGATTLLCCVMGLLASRATIRARPVVLLKGS